MASSSEMGIPSLSDDKTRMSAAAKQAPTFRRSPKKVTRLSKPELAIVRGAPESEPSPTFKDEFREPGSSPQGGYVIFRRGQSRCDNLLEANASVAIDLKSRFMMFGITKGSG